MTDRMSRHAIRTARAAAAVLTILIAARLAAPAGAQQTGAGAIPDPVAVLRAVERNQAYGSIEYEGTMTIRAGKKTRTKTMKAWSDGKDRALIEYANPEDRGTRMLKLGDNLWVYFPKERDTVKIAGYLLTQGMMGSDVSYRDAMESDSLLDGYDARFIREEAVGGRRAWVIELTAKSPSEGYSRRVVWIDAEKPVVLRSEVYGRSGMALKRTETLGVSVIAGRHFPSKVEITDLLKKESRTVFEMTSIRLDVPLDDSKFSLQALSR